MAIIKDEGFRVLKPNVKLVYFILRAHKNKRSGECWPSITALCKATGLCRQTVCNAVRDLQAAGLISVELKPHWKKPNTRINVYTVIDQPEIAQSTGQTVQAKEKTMQHDRKTIKKAGAQSILRPSTVYFDGEHSLLDRLELYTMNSSNENSTSVVSKKHSPPAPQDGLSLFHETISLLKQVGEEATKMHRLTVRKHWREKLKSGEWPSSSGIPELDKCIDDQVKEALS